VVSLVLVAVLKPARRVEADVEVAA